MRTGHGAMLALLFAGCAGGGAPGPAQSRLVGQGDAATPDALPTAGDAGEAPLPDVLPDLAARGEDPGNLSEDAQDVPGIAPDVAADDTGAPAPPPLLPSLYPPGALFSPLSPAVVANLQAIRAADPALRDDVFMKVGASSTVSKNNLACFAGSAADLGEHPELQPALDYHLAGDAAGSTPFDRQTLAAKVGVSAGWAFAGSPSPIDEEADAISPGLAIVHYGTNDMQLGVTHETAIWKFGDDLLTLVDILADRGAVPLLLTIYPRGDNAAADQWVPTYNAVIRGVAQARQIPVTDVHQAFDALPGKGLASDGIHPNVYPGGACVLTAEGLKNGYNARNLLSLQVLDRVRMAILGDLAEGEPAVLAGDGSPGAPFEIPFLPFSDLRDTTASPNKNLTLYGGCNAPQDESGSEYLYRLVLAKPTRLRMMVFDRGDVDIDLHLLDESASEAGCIERNHKIIQRPLLPGTYTLSLDTFVSQGEPKPGEYLLVVLECHPDDPTCD